MPKLSLNTYFAYRPIMPHNSLRSAAVLEDHHLLAAATVLSIDGAS